MSEKDIPQKILEKLKKLLAFKEGAQKIDSQAEVENAALRINELLIKYNISLENLDMGKTEDKIDEEKFTYDKKSYDNSWHRSLFTVIANVNLCEVITMYKTRNAVSVLIIGKDLNREIVKYTVSQLASKIEIMSKKSWDSYYGFDKRNTYIRGFKMGCVVGINRKLKAQKKEMLKNESMNSLILRSDQALLEYMGKNHRNICKKKTRSTSSLTGYVEGVKAGSQMNINKGLEKSSIKSRLLT